MACKFTNKYIHGWYFHGKSRTKLMESLFLESSDFQDNLFFLITIWTTVSVKLQYMNSSWMFIKIGCNKFSSFLYSYALIFAQGILHWLFPRQTTSDRDLTLCENNFVRNLLLRMWFPNNILEFVIANEQLLRILRIRFLEY